ncbi:hypothetical protein Ocin01_15366 [Orchesella cincta]|uniref:Uncharacterized protein n=1 Tax=Orchesella cincta TaxID=48709 RepID=A0A1D2MEP1_ORCCI|nr:hypothetical protein Ocin01_15366 [Orchesella cincta]
MTNIVFLFAHLCVILVVLMVQVQGQACRFAGEGCRTADLCEPTNSCCCSGECDVGPGQAWGFCQ